MVGLGGELAIEAEESLLIWRERLRLAISNGPRIRTWANITYCKRYPLTLMSTLFFWWGFILSAGNALEDEVCFVERAALLVVEVRVSPRRPRYSDSINVYVLVVEVALALSVTTVVGSSKQLWK